jgi:hypothetical protein
MYQSLLLPWSPHPHPSETLYRSANLIKTKGTIFLLPPTPSTLRDSFNAPPRPYSRMSAGAVALCKHFERGGASSEHGRMHPFWKLPRGSNEEKNVVAGEILEEMLRDVRWRNVMMLHQGVAVYEVRNGRGWGMRWSLEVGRKSEKRGGEGGSGSVVDGQEERGEEEEVNEEEWKITKTTFRGFLEPIAGMDHELEVES